jgi:hypothetical protein
MLKQIQAGVVESVPGMLMAGAAIGGLMARLMVQTLGLDSRLALEALVLISLQISAPTWVNLIRVSHSAPLEVARSARRRLQRSDAAPSGGSGWHLREMRLTTSALVAILLLPYFLGAAFVTAGILTPRGDLLLEIEEMMSFIGPQDLLQCVLRTGLFAGVVQAICLRKGNLVRRSLEELPGLIASAIQECYLAVFALEAFWLVLLDPLHLRLR